MTYPSGQIQTIMEHLALESSETLHTKFQTRRHEPHVWPLAQSIVDDGLVLVHRDRAGRVDDVAARGRVGRDGIDGAEDELFLEMREELEVALGLRVSFVHATGRHLRDTGRIVSSIVNRLAGAEAAST